MRVGVGVGARGWGWGWGSSCIAAVCSGGGASRPRLSQKEAATPMRPEADWTALEKDCSASAAAEYSRSHA